MPSVLDNFVISLAVDSRGTIQGIRDATGAIHVLEKDAIKSGKIIDSSEKKKSTAYQKSSKSVRKTGKEAIDAGTKAADAFSAFRREAFAAFALFTGGRSLKAFLGDVSSANIQMGNLKNTITNIPTEKFIQLGAAVDVLGGNKNDPANWLTELQSEGATADGKAYINNTPLAKMIGPIVGDDGNPRADLFEAIAHNQDFQKQFPNIKRAYLDQIHAPEGVKNLLTSPDFDKLTNHFSGFSISDKDIQAAQNLSISLEDLRLQTEAFNRLILTEVSPEITKFIKSITELEKSHPEEIAKGLSLLALAITGLATLKFIPSPIKKLLTSPTALVAGATAVAEGHNAEEKEKALKNGGELDVFTGSIISYGKEKEAKKPTKEDLEKDKKIRKKGLFKGTFEALTGYSPSDLGISFESGKVDKNGKIIHENKTNEATSKNAPDQRPYFLDDLQKNFDAQFGHLFHPEKAQQSDPIEKKKTYLSQNSETENNSVNLLKIPSQENVETPENDSANLEALNNFLKYYQSKVSDITSQNSETVTNINKSYNSQISDASSSVSHVTNDNRSYTAEVHVHDIEYGGDPQVIANTIGKQLLEHWSHPEGGGLR